MMYYYGIFPSLALAEAFAAEVRRNGYYADVYADCEVWTSKPAELS